MIIFATKTACRFHQKNILRVRFGALDFFKYENLLIFIACIYLIFNLEFDLIIIQMKSNGKSIRNRNLKRFLERSLLKSFTIKVKNKNSNKRLKLILLSWYQWNRINHLVSNTSRFYEYVHPRFCFLHSVNLNQELSLLKIEQKIQLFLYRNKFKRMEFSCNKKKNLYPHENILAKKTKITIWKANLVNLFIKFQAKCKIFFQKLK